jgi:O-antigen ligase
LTLAPAATWIAFVKILAALAVIYLCWTWSGDRKFRSLLFTAVMSLGVFSAVVGLMDQWFHRDLMKSWRPSDDFGYPHHWGFFYNRNHFSNYLNISVMLGLGVFFRNAMPKKGQNSKAWKAIFALFTVLLCATASISTASKGGLISLFMGIGVFCVFLSAQKIHRTQLKLVAAVTLASMGLILAYARPTVDRMKGWVSGLQGGDMDGRWEIWQDAWKMGIEMKGRGIGVGAFQTTFPIFQTALGYKSINYPENEYLQTWVEWGWVGSALWLLILFTFLSRMIQTFVQGCGVRRSAAWSACSLTLFHAAVDFPFHIPANAWLFCALLGSVLSHRPGHDSRSEPSQRFSRGRMACGGVGLILMISSIIGWGPTRRDLSLIEARILKQDFEGARRLSIQATQDWPFYWRAHELAGISAAGVPAMSREALRSYQRAQRLAQSNPMISLHAGTVFFATQPGIARRFFDSNTIIFRKE